MFTQVVRTTKPASPMRYASFVGALLLCVATHAQPVVGIFSDALEVVVDDASLVLRKRIVSVDLARLESSVTGTALGLNVFDGVMFTGIVEYRSSTEIGYAISGTIAGVWPSSFTIVVNGGVVTGDLTTPSEFYRLRTTDGRYVISLVDPTEYTLSEHDCGLVKPRQNDAAEHSGNDLGPTRASDKPMHKGTPPEPTDYLPSNLIRTDGVTALGVTLDAGSTCPIDEQPNVLDLLVAYTSSASTDAGGAAQVRAAADSATAFTNAVLQRSRLNIRLRLVGTVTTTYVESGNRTVDLDRLGAEGDGYLDDVDRARNLCTADLVYLIVSRLDAVGAARYFTGLAVIRQKSFAPGWVMAHELGHNFGINHDRYSHHHDEGKNTPQAYRYAYVNQRAFDPGSTRPCFVTRSGLASQCLDHGLQAVWVHQYSNPLQTFEGDPMGVAGDQSTTRIDGPADAVRRIREYSPLLMNERIGLKRLQPIIGDSLTMQMLLKAESERASSSMDSMRAGP